MKKTHCVPLFIFISLIITIPEICAQGTTTMGKLNIAVSSVEDSAAIRIGVPGDPGRLDAPIGMPTGGYNIDFHTFRDVRPNQIGGRIRAERINIYAPNAAYIQGMDLAFFTSVANEQTDLTERFRITCKGYVGIGTSQPSNFLNINPKGPGGITIGNPNSGSDGYTNLIMNISEDKHGYGEFQVIKSAGGSWGDIIMNRQGGNVGIGTTDTKGYRLAVAGSMIAEKIRVKMQSAWPDYVFSKDYVLPPLQEVERYIKANGHLPDVPSGKEVQEEGLDLGEMDRKLLQKVEELTLYLVNMQTLIEQQNKRIEELERNAIQIKNNNP